jgi:hypothetical protein
MNTHSSKPFRRIRAESLHQLEGHWRYIKTTVFGMSMYIYIYIYIYIYTHTHTYTHSSKIFTFIDLAGHERYIKTTVYGMTGSVPDYAMVVIGANMGVLRMTREHLGVALALKYPLIFAITKTDMCPDNILKQTLDDLCKILRSAGVKKMPYIVRCMFDLCVFMHMYIILRCAGVKKMPYIVRCMFVLCVCMYMYVILRSALVKKMPYVVRYAFIVNVYTCICT